MVPVRQDASDAIDAFYIHDAQYLYIGTPPGSSATIKREEAAEGQHVRRPGGENEEMRQGGRSPKESVHSISTNVQVLNNDPVTCRCCLIQF